MNRFSIAGLILVLVTVELTSQVPVFTRQDTLRGSITPEREWWDLKYYHLDISVNPADSTIRGSNTVTYSVLKPNTTMQIDLQPPMKIDAVTMNGRPLEFTREGNVYRIGIVEKQEAGKVYSIKIEYGGKPIVSERPPWTGGITWNHDSKGLPFVASAVQGEGASIWWPCKDHMYDEPDSMLMSVNVPGNLTDVSNGRLRKVEKKKNGTRTFHWFVSSPISNYAVNINIADYAHFSEVFKGEKGNLDCDYYVLKENLEKAKAQFKQVPMMLKAFEHWFGPYPFYEDGFKLVEAPYLGMEHQSSVTYGNGYRNGYMGRDLSSSGWGLKFDFIIIHESGHEWFANNITYADVADMWVHESFTNYSEGLYVEYHYGKDAGEAYIRGSRMNIRNDRPIIGIYDVNYSGSGDMYYKGGSMLHTLRQIVNDDEKWRSILRNMNRDYYHQVVTGSQIEKYLSEKTGLDLRSFFNQYLRDVRIPVLEYYVKGKELTFRWGNCVRGFNMPVKIYVSGKEMNIKPTAAFSAVEIDTENAVITADPDYYVAVMNITGE
jgi:aminopeptidase N